MSDMVEPVKRDVKALKGASKVARIPIKIVPSDPKRKPEWIRAKSQGAPEVQRIKKMLRDHDLHTVCEEASCPNLGECFAHGTATFLIMGNICTRRCPSVMWRMAGLMRWMKMNQIIWQNHCRHAIEARRGDLSGP